jgi:L-lactate dehydrogenase (cytochrome)
LGERGVARAIHFLRKELDVTMALCGVNNVREIGRQVIA